MQLSIALSFIPVNTIIMKAAICTKYGPPEVLQVKDIAKPSCRADEILVAVMATSVNSGDVRVRALAVPKFLNIVMRIVLGFRKPRNPVLGTVFSGIVEQAGAKVSTFKPGDRVFGVTGFKFGACAEYICIKESSIVAVMPLNASFVEAAALPFGWHTAIYFLRKANIAQYSKPRVLVYGASGSVGSAAVQLARHYNAVVYAVCSSNGEKLMNNLHVDDIVFYDREDFTRRSSRYDIIFDAAGKISSSVCKRLLNPGGRFVTVGGLDMAAENVAQLHFIRQLFEDGKCLALIDRIYSLKEIAAAHRYVDSGRKKGNVIITIGANGGGHGEVLPSLAPATV